MYTWGWLNRLMPSSGTISWMEQSRIMGSCNNQPSFILSSAAGPSIPTHHEAPGYARIAMAESLLFCVMCGLELDVTPVFET